MIEIDDHKIEVLEVDKGLDKDENHVDTKFKILFMNQHLVLHAYNTTQNLMVQGKQSEQFAINCLEPFFKRQINKSLDKITNVNEGVKESLTLREKRKGFNCAHCNVKSSTLPDLKVHLKVCHSKPSLDSPRHKKSMIVKDPPVLTFSDSGDLLSPSPQTSSISAPE